MSVFWAYDSAIIEAQLCWYKEVQIHAGTNSCSLDGQTRKKQPQNPHKTPEKSIGFIYNSKQRCLLQETQVYLHQLAHNKSRLVNV